MSLSAIADSILAPSAETHAATKPARKEASAFAAGSDTPTFWDLIDIINPLQHIPVVSTIYRAITGDELGQVPRVVGGILFGGPTGLIGAVANAVMQENTGKDIGEHVVAALFGDGEPATDTMLADQAPNRPVTIAWNDPPPAHPPATIAWNDPPLLAQDATGAPTALHTFATAAGPTTLQVPAPIALPVAPPVAPPIAPMAAAAPAAPPPAILPPPLALATQPVSLLPKGQDGIVAAGSFVPLSPDILNPPQTIAKAAAGDETQPDRFARKPPSAAGGQPMGHGKLFAAAAPYLVPRTGADQVRRAAQAQGIEPINHPMLQAADATGADSEWMARAMAGALDKYRQGARLQTPRD